MTRPRVLAHVVVILAAVDAASAFALPTMIRLSYNTCVTCHVSPQGGGLLTEYGRGIDEAQSLRGGEYRPVDNELVSAMSWHGRIIQDLRLVIQDTHAWASRRPDANVLRPRLMYRNVTQLTGAFRVSATITGETEAAPRPARVYDPGTPPASAFVNTALLHYRAHQALELAAGRDQLPSGINIPDLAAFFKSRNRLGYYDAPLQLKMYWTGQRYQVVPFVYGPGGNEPAGERESGAGTLAELDVLGTHRTVVGMSVLQAAARNGGRRVVGTYARLGFGAWGILAEHDISDRARDTPTDVDVRQHVTYAQLFWAVREWLVASAIGERLSVQEPFEERLAAGKIEIAARFTSVASLIVSVRVQRDLLTGRESPSVAVQGALKTVH
jgi:hypothetical protein